jgi:polyisoprenyl-teichoic acid--peptidoglycan teichoic acid transferase
MKKLLYILGTLFLLLLLAGGGYAYYLYDSVQGTIDSEMHVELERDQSEERETELDMDNEDPVSFLLLGVDAEDSKQGLTDTMMVVTVNPARDSMRMVSLPRDTRVEIPGYGEDKINHAYGLGGADLALDTVEKYLDLPLDYFVTINMEGFEEMVDAVGGVPVENDFAFEQNDIFFPEGDVYLDGERALAYSRMRKEDPDGDLGRNARQRQVVNALIDEGAQLSSVTRAEELLDVLGSNILTNLDFDKMMKLQQHYASARHNQETLEIEGDGERIDGIWYLMVQEEERERISADLREHLELEDTRSVHLE